MKKTASGTPPWNALQEWKHQEIDWIRVNIRKEDLQRYTRRSYAKGLVQTLGFLAMAATTGAWAYGAFLNQRWMLMVLALYCHGIVYGHFGHAIHELVHGTVFPGKWLNRFFTVLFGWLNWTWNPYLYRASHVHYHHRYTLFQGSDGEDTPNYVEFTWRSLYDLFLNVLHWRQLMIYLWRLFTLTPTSWRGLSFNLDNWERFVIRHAGEKDRQAIHRFAVFILIGHVSFVGACLYVSLRGIMPSLWFLPLLITFAPFYGPQWHGVYCVAHQHSACEANNPDFRLSCGTVRLNPLSSFLYWHMEYHIEHHMFAAIPCYHLKAFRKAVEDQMPPRMTAIPRLAWLHRVCKEKYGSWQYWRDHFGRYKGI